ncbi:MAG: TrmH family RNA methyltransferase [Halobacteria archaeon]|nr:TrmH family RNA methyltransferase [Halobacteria archaeon]
MGSRQESKNRRNRRKNAVLRYQKEKWRNQTASPGVHDFILVLDHLKAGFNIPKIFRSAEAFGAREVHLIDIATFDPAPAKGAFRKVPARFHATFRDCHESLRKQGYTLFILQANCDTILHQTALPRKSAFILGNEGLGISFSPLDFPDIHCLRIPQFGSMESLNVSIAASIVMYEYIRQQQQ